MTRAETSDRRNLTDDQRAMIADKAAELESKLVIVERGKKGGRGHKRKLSATASNNFEPPKDTRAKAAKAAKVSERFRIEVEPVASDRWQAPPERRLARLLKAMLRGYGFRCVDARPVEPDAPTASQRTTQASVGSETQ